MEKELNFTDFAPLNMFVEHEFTKVASKEDTIDTDAYCAGLEAGLGLIPEGTEAMAKVASRQMGRELMKEFIPYLFLDK